VCICVGWGAVDGEIICVGWGAVDGEIICVGWGAVDGEIKHARTLSWRKVAWHSDRFNRMKHTRATKRSPNALHASCWNRILSLRFLLSASSRSAWPKSHRNTYLVEVSGVACVHARVRLDGRVPDQCRASRLAGVM
jgi:hypothetical protein